MYSETQRARERERDEDAEAEIPEEEIEALLKTQDEVKLQQLIAERVS